MAKNICKQCKHYKLMVKTRDLNVWDSADLTCLFCADYPHRKSRYEKDMHGFVSDTPAYRQESLPSIQKSNT